jgi:superfamily II DNA/RNA helicase
VKIQFFKDTGIGVIMARGQMYMSEFRQQVFRENGCDILVITPGKLKHFLVDRIIRPDNLQFLVVDEADKYFSEGDLVDGVQLLMEQMVASKVIIFCFITITKRIPFFTE